MSFRFKKKTYNTKFIEVEGLVSYAKIYEPDDYNGKEFWSLNLHPDEENRDKIKAAGCQTKFKKEGNEEYSNVPGGFYKFKRDLEATIKGEKVEFNPPEVFDADGKPLVTYDGSEMKGQKLLIGNGSKISVTLEVYKTQIGNGTRLRSIKILDLIKYDPNKDKVEDSEKEEVSQNSSEEVKVEGGDTPW